MKWYTHAIFAIFIGAIIGYLFRTELTIQFFIITIIASLIIDFAEKALFNEHRRQLHNLFTIIPCILIYLFLDMTIGAALTAGILSHILLDCITPTGCRFLWPLQEKRYGVQWKYTGNKAREKRILSTTILLALLTILVLLPHGPLTSAITAWTNNTGHNSTNSTYPNFHISINNPSNDMWIHPFPNGSVFIDVVNNGQADYYPVYYPVYHKSTYQGSKPTNANSTPQEKEEEVEE
ncbi:MAG: metal-dependent hydrolase [Thermoplasmatales archaeon]|nr:metal-dependent hydrolase [Thermoplasmatales archaeon]